MASVQDAPIQATYLPPLISYVVMFALGTSVLHYLLASSRPNTPKTVNNEGDHPPLIPYVIPLLGNLPLSFLRDPLGFSFTYSAFWKRQPVRLRSLFQEIYIIQGAKDLVGMVKQRSLSSFFVHQTFLTGAFMLPKAAAETYYKDNSGEHIKPHPGTSVEHHNRVEFHVRTSQQKLLLGRGQSSLFRRLYSNATRRLSSLQIGEDWTHISDFLDIFKSDLTAAVVESMAGPALMQRHPSFAKDMWAIDENVIGFVLRQPRFMNRKAHQARDRALSAVLEWQSWARENFTPDSIDEDGNDPFWGSSFFRERHEMFSKMDGFSPEAIACEDLSFIWSAHTNAIIATFWITLEAFRDPQLLRDVREEVKPCIIRGPENQISFDVDKLVRQPLVQAMFAESLRLRVHGFLIRRPEREDIKINNWVIPRKSLCVASNTPASMDPDFWCSGENSAYPVDRFWPGRFLKRDPDTDSLQFSLVGTDGYWIPFGGGPHACPGRILTKRQNILTLALMVTLYDCEILATKKDLEMKSGTYPLGVIPPRGKIPVRMRRRAVP